MIAFILGWKHWENLLGIQVYNSKIEVQDWGLVIFYAQFYDIVAMQT
jgi:hypothetical protein